MAYKRKIPKYKCCRCEKNATHEVLNRFNSSVGFYCDWHADQIIKELNDREIYRDRSKKT